MYRAETAQSRRRPHLVVPPVVLPQHRVLRVRAAEDFDAFLGEGGAEAGTGELEVMMGLPL